MKMRNILLEIADLSGIAEMIYFGGLDQRLTEVLLDAGAQNDVADKIGWTVRPLLSPRQVSTLHPK